jgi:hypothetical protein
MLAPVEGPRIMNALALLFCSACAVPAEDPCAVRGWGPFIHIPCPTPILTPRAGAWDSWIIEASDAFKDEDTYFLYYHAAGAASYQLGVATAEHPLGPFERYGDAPVLTLGPKGSWDDAMVACAMVLKEADDRWLMWYSGHGSSKETSRWSVGLATAASPTGPWTKHGANPIIEDFGYVGGVVKVDGEYRLYVAHPIGSTGPDYSPMSLATAYSPGGPWTKHPENPVLREGQEGEWDHGGFSEAEVFHADGLHHMFYGGATILEPRIKTRESVGYAYSADGIHFTKAARNPVVDLADVPNASAFAEVHAVHEPPFIFLYHTLRYEEAWRPGDDERMPMIEDIGVQVLVTERPYRLEIPVLRLESLAPMGRSSLADSSVISLGSCESLVLNFEGSFARSARAGVRVELHGSRDGKEYLPEDVQAWNLEAIPGEVLRASLRPDALPSHAKVLILNLDGARIEEPFVSATLEG